MRRVVLVALTLLAFVISASAQFTFTSLDYPGGTLTTARGINDHGQIVGAYRIVPPRHALLIKNGERRSGDCARKAAELTSGDLFCVAQATERAERRADRRQKSAEGIVGH